MNIRCLFGCCHKVAYQGFARTVQTVENPIRPLSDNPESRRVYAGLSWYSLKTDRFDIDKAVSYCEREGCNKRKIYNIDDCPLPVLVDDEKGICIYRDSYCYRDFMSGYSRALSSE